MFSARIPSSSLVKLAQLRYASYQPVLSTFKFAQLRHASYQPALSKYKFAQLRHASYQPVLSTIKLTSCCIEKGQNRAPATGVKHGQIALPSNFIISRSYSADPKPPNLPSKAELQKHFFKIVAVLWDLARGLILYTWTLFKTHVIYNPNVQSYWKKFNKKLEEGRKN